MLTVNWIANRNRGMKLNRLTIKGRSANIPMTKIAGVKKKRMDWVMGKDKV